jgi:ribulose 1,5-bisphosphate carboxylase large subunit-like protein
MGAGCHAHPNGTKEGAKALVQSCEAFLENIDIDEYAKTHKELKQAITFFRKNKSKKSTTSKTKLKKASSKKTKK